VREPARARLSGAWLIIAPGGEGAGDVAGLCAEALSACGARVLTVRAGTGEVGREALAARIARALAGPVVDEPVVDEPADAGVPGGGPAVGVSGVVSLLALDAAPL